MNFTHEYIASFDRHRYIPEFEGRFPCGLYMYGDRGVAFLMPFPFYHLAGFSMGLAPLFYESEIVLPPLNVPPNGKVIIDIMRSLELTVMSCPPSIYEDLIGEYQEDFLACSRKLKMIVFGGGMSSCPSARFRLTLIQDRWRRRQEIFWRNECWLRKELGPQKLP